MQPITREIMDRRQPAIRWSAVIAGAAVALGLWGVLQLLGLGAGLAAIDPRDVEQNRQAAIGATAWSVIVPLIALFVGGYVAGKLASTHDRKLLGTHALIMWGIAAVGGLAFSMWLAWAAARGAYFHGHMMMSGRMRGGPGVSHDALVAASNTGKGLLAFGVAMLLSIASAIAGALLAERGFRRHGREGRKEPVATTPTEPPIVDASGAPLTPTTTAT